MTKFRVDLVLDCREAESLAMFWTQALHYRRHMSWEGGIALVPEKGEGPPLILQQVPEEKGPKNRMHLDITTDEIEPEVQRLESLGAKRLSGLQKAGPTSWLTMADTEGNEFCVCTGVEW